MLFPHLLRSRLPYTPSPTSSPLPGPGKGPAPPPGVTGPQAAPRAGTHSYEWAQAELVELKSGLLEAPIPHQEARHEIYAFEHKNKR